MCAAAIRRQTELGVEKLCSCCNEWWPADGEFFYQNQARSDGLTGLCKACFASHQRVTRRGVPPMPHVPEVLRLVLRPGAAP